jgi:hypothetical protein
VTQETFECGGRIQHGHLKIEGRQVFEQTMARFDDGPVTLRITAGKRSRTSNQNKFFHGVIVKLIAEHTGYSLSEAKDAILLTLIPQEITDIKTGEIVRVPGHSSRLTVKEFNELIERALQLGAELGVYIPTPDEVAV